MTDDLSQCGNCIYHYTYNGRDMCKQVGDDFYLQWKVENCPYHTSITKVAAISDEIYRLKAENAALRERLDKAVELPCRVGTTVYGVGFFDCEDAYTEDKKKKREIFHHCMKMNGDCEKCKYRRPSIEEFVCTHIQIGACGLGGQKILIVGEKNENYTGENIYLTREAAEARLAELKGGAK